MDHSRLSDAGCTLTRAPNLRDRAMTEQRPNEEANADEAPEQVTTTLLRFIDPALGDSHTSRAAR